MMTFVEFMKKHTTGLGRIKDKESLSKWHRQFAMEWSSNATAYAEDANALFSLSDEKEIKPDVGYLAVEAQGNKNTAPIILLSCNPSYDPRTSVRFSDMLGQDLEHNSLDVDKYEAFRQSFFPRYIDDIRKHCFPKASSYGWWQNAMPFLHLIVEEEYLGECVLAEELNLIGWEIFPLRSSKDGLTPLIETNPLLKEFAVESISAALRMDSHCVIVASKVGYDLLKDRQEELDLVCLSDKGKTIAKIKVAHYRNPKGISVFAIRRQTFAGFALSKERRKALTDWIKLQMDENETEGDENETRFH